ncbi:MAG TPA: cobalamin-binding protein [bacterium]|nr:cobalamin-binding protein [bacterium]
MTVRIVSLLPSATEIVCALGLADALVGISHDCDFPPGVRGKPVLSEAIVGPSMPSPMIEARIRGAVHTGRSVYHLDEAALAGLAPDLIITQELCTVCAPAYTLVRHAANLLAREPKLVSLEPHGLFDVLDNIMLIGELTGTARRARAVVDRLQGRIDAVRARARATGVRPRVACLEWLDPIYVGGHWLPEMVEAAGGLDVLGHGREPSRVVGWEVVSASTPEVLMLMPCGFDLARTRREFPAMAARPGWCDLPSVRNGRVYLTDASSYFNRPGPRLVDGLEILASAIHPDAFAFKLPPRSLQRVSSRWRCGPTGPGDGRTQSPAAEREGGPRAKRGGTKRWRGSTPA